MAGRIAEELRVRGRQKEAEAFAVVANPKVCLSLIGPEGHAVDALEQEAAALIYVRSDSGMHPERYDVIPGTKKEIEKRFPVLRKTRRIKAESEDFLHVPGACLVVEHKGILIEVPEVSSGHDEPIELRVTRGDRSFYRASPAS